MQHQGNAQSLQSFTNHLPDVKKYLTELEHQDLWWTTVAMVGRINNENIEAELLNSIVETQKEFQHLRDIMIEELIQRYLNQANSEIALKTQATIDILIRNLFERTADVGFLATDDDIVNYLNSDSPSVEDITFIHRRIEEYVAKYSVYDDVLLINPNGEIKAKLNPENPVSHSDDPIIHQALTSSEEYLEVYRHSDLFPQKDNSLIYAKKIEANVNGVVKTVGVLCLSFDFEDEVDRLFKTLKSDQEGYAIMLLDDTGKALASNMPDDYPVGKQHSKPEDLTQPNHKGDHIHYTSRTTGYQGFHGLPWYGYATIPNQVAFNDKSNIEELNVTIPKHSPLYLTELEDTNLKVSTLLLIVILNGKITSLKKGVKSFLPILDSFQNISVDIQEIFNSFIHHIHNVLVKTIQAKVAFSATLAIEIMDRNLYERANDCRWWALNSRFRQTLSRHNDTGVITERETTELSNILAYINELYTVYTNIILYDRAGKILAVSNATESHIVGTTMPRANDTSSCLAINNTQNYVVSDFHATSLYGGEHTYIYHAAIKDWRDENKNVGGIALIFDSTAEFKAMLADTDPQYSNPKIKKTTFSAFIDRSGNIISTTHHSLSAGDHIDAPIHILQAQNGESKTISWEWQGQLYLVGYKVSEGYREFKNGDGYNNDVIALVFTGI